MIAEEDGREHDNIMKRAIILAYIAAAVLTATSCGPRPKPEVAKMTLGSSRAVLAVTTFDDRLRPGTSRRMMSLTSSDGRSGSLRLRDAGGSVGNDSLSLFHLNGPRYRLLSERDCLDMDAELATLARCSARLKGDYCAGDVGTFIGAFNWMNGFDPDGAWTYRFRYLPAPHFQCAIKPRPA